MGRLGWPTSTGAWRRALPGAMSAAAAAIALAAAVPSSAGASTAALDGSVLRVTGSAGVDELTIRAEGGELVVRDGFTTTTAGAGCSATALGWASCPMAEISSVQVDLGAGDDVIIVASPRPIVVRGGEGDDALLAGGSPIGVTLDGGPGDDHLAGGPLGDSLIGGTGDDGLDGGFGDDLILPGPGRDAISDEAGADTIDAADGEPDVVDCGPGLDHGAFDRIDVTRGCEGAPAAQPTDCTPEIAPPSSRDARRLRRGLALHLELRVQAGCRATASLAVAGVAYARAGLAEASTGVTLRLPAAGRRALRQHRSVLVRVRVLAPAGTVIARRFRLAP